MSRLVHCDGPGCVETKDTDYEVRAMCDRGWLKVSEGEGVRSLDFHSRDCLAAWTAAQEQPVTKVVDGS